MALDFLRFLSALFIVAFHFEIFVTKESRLFKEFNAGVDFFFVLSGFVIMHSVSGALPGRDVPFFLWRRLARIYPLHLATLGVAILIGTAALRLGFPIGEPERYDLSYLPGNLLLVQAWGFHDRLTFNIVSWSISAEWFLYLTFPLWLWLVRRAGPLRTLALVALVIVAMKAAEWAGLMMTWNDRTYEAAIVRAAPAFVIGIALWAVWRRLDGRFAPGWLPVAACFLLATLAMLLRLPREVALALFALIVLLAALAEARPLPQRAAGIMETLGNASFALYMLHHMIGMVLIALAPRLHVQALAMAAAAAGLSVVLSIFCFRWFENPTRAYLNEHSPFLPHRPRPT